MVGSRAVELERGAHLKSTANCTNCCLAESGSDRGVTDFVLKINVKYIACTSEKKHVSVDCAAFCRAVEC